MQMYVRQSYGCCGDAYSVRIDTTSQLLQHMVFSLYPYYTSGDGPSGCMAWDEVLGCLDVVIRCSNPTQGTDVCPDLFIITIIHFSPHHQCYIV